MGLFVFIIIVSVIVGIANASKNGGDEARCKMGRTSSNTTELMVMGSIAHKHRKK